MTPSDHLAEPISYRWPGQLQQAGMPPKGFQAVRQPTRKSAEAQPLSIRFNFLFEAAQSLTSCPLLAAHFGRSALKVADEPGVVVPRRSALQLCERCGVALVPECCTSAVLRRPRRSTTTQPPATAVQSFSFNRKPPPARSTAPLIVAVLVRTCRLCAHENQQQFSSENAAQQAAQSETLAIHAAGAMLVEQRCQRRTAAGDAARHATVNPAPHATVAAAAAVGPTGAEAARNPATGATTRVPARSRLPPIPPPSPVIALVTAQRVCAPRQPPEQHTEPRLQSAPPHSHTHQPTHIESVPRERQRQCSPCSAPDPVVPSHPAIVGPCADDSPAAASGPALAPHPCATPASPDISHIPPAVQCQPCVPTTTQAATSNVALQQQQQQQQQQKASEPCGDPTTHTASGNTPAAGPAATLTPPHTTAGRSQPSGTRPPPVHNPPPSRIETAGAPPAASSPECSSSSSQHHPCLAAPEADPPHDAPDEPACSSLGEGLRRTPQLKLVVALRAELKACGLPASGHKSDLVQRLALRLQQGQETQQQQASTAPAVSLQLRTEAPDPAVSRQPPRDSPVGNPGQAGPHAPPPPRGVTQPLAAAGGGGVGRGPALSRPVCRNSDAPHALAVTPDTAGSHAAAVSASQSPPPTRTPRAGSDPHLHQLSPCGNTQAGVCAGTAGQGPPGPDVVEGTGACAPSGLASERHIAQTEAQDPACQDPARQDPARQDAAVQRHGGSEQRPATQQAAGQQATEREAVEQQAAAERQAAPSKAIAEGHASESALEEAAQKALVDQQASESAQAAAELQDATAGHAEELEQAALEAADAARCVAAQQFAEQSRLAAARAAAEALASESEWAAVAQREEARQVALLVGEEAAVAQQEAMAAAVATAAAAQWAEQAAMQSQQQAILKAAAAAAAAAAASASQAEAAAAAAAAAGLLTATPCIVSTPTSAVHVPATLPEAAALEDATPAAGGPVISIAAPNTSTAARSPAQTRVATVDPPPLRSVPAEQASNPSAVPGEEARRQRDIPQPHTRPDALTVERAARAAGGGAVPMQSQEHELPAPALFRFPLALPTRPHSKRAKHAPLGSTSQDLPAQRPDMRMPPGGLRPGSSTGHTPVAFCSTCSHRERPFASPPAAASQQQTQQVATPRAAAGSYPTAARRPPGSTTSRPAEDIRTLSAAALLSLVWEAGSLVRKEAPPKVVVEGAYMRGLPGLRPGTPVADPRYQAHHPHAVRQRLRQGAQRFHHRSKRARS
ncbi:MAG: hypothetical protein WDW38_000505 [Sanguina aurantia]